MYFFKVIVNANKLGLIIPKSVNNEGNIGCCIIKSPFSSVVAFFNKGFLTLTPGKGSLVLLSTIFPVTKPNSIVVGKSLIGSRDEVFTASGIVSLPVCLFLKVDWAWAKAAAPPGVEVILCISSSKSTPIKLKANLKSNVGIVKGSKTKKSIPVASPKALREPWSELTLPPSWFPNARVWPISLYPKDPVGVGESSSCEV